MKNPTVVSLFSGGGGLDLGLEAVGFKTLFASDIDYHSCRTLEAGGEFCRNNDLPFLSHATVHQSDVCDLTAAQITNITKTKPGEIDLLAGGPPCQAFSVFGRRKGLADKRGTMAYQYLRLLAELKPKAFVFENVFGLLTIDGGAIYEDLCKKLSSPGNGVKYTLSTFRLNAANYGVPQFRDRVFIIGCLDGGSISKIPATHGEPSTLFMELRPWRTVQDALRWLPPMGEGDFANHTGRKHSDRIIKRYDNLSPGERDPKTRINKLDLSRPSYAIIVGSDAGGGKGHVHPTIGREVTPRESARIQTFPDWWSFFGTGRHPIRQIGNAVPPILGAAVGNEIRRQIFGLRRVSEGKILELLSQEHLAEMETSCSRTPV